MTGTSKTNTKLLPFDSAHYLTDGAAIAEYMTAVLEPEDTDLLLLALGDVARAESMAQVTKDAGLGRESLCKALSPGAKPRLDTISRSRAHLAFGSQRILLDAHVGTSV